MTKNKKKQIPFPLFTRSPKKKTIGGKIQNQPKGKEKKRKKSIIKRKAQTIKKK